jgi:chorismate mutase/prephenate dehydratase
VTVNSTLYFLGPEGTFAHAAAQSVAAREHSAEKLHAVSTIVGVFEEVAQDVESRGIVPIENSTEGSVNFTLDALLDFDRLNIVGEEIIAVEQCLLGSGNIADVEVVHSHPHALAQCKHWLRQYLPHARLISTSSTAAAALAVRDTPHHAAIGSELAASIATLAVLARGIQDRKRNATRFIVLGHQTAPASGNDKTSLVFTTRHERGALHRVLAIFDAHGINLSKIESRPMPDSLWQYVFFVDLEGHQSAPNVASALQILRDNQQVLRIFGSYPAALAR